MAKKNNQPVPPSQYETRTSLSPQIRVVLALVLPIAISLLLGRLAGNVTGLGESQTNAPLLAGVGIVSWVLGLSWYGLTQIGLRGGRPLFAGIGFATLGWVTFLVLRAVLLPIYVEPGGNGRIFVYLLLFEAFAVQLWTYGLLFRSVADWRGPLTAAITSGLVFGAAAFVLFQESVLGDPLSLAYFIVWGIFYGIIRLRTGSLIGSSVVQALQSFSAWVVLGSMTNVASPISLRWLYILVSIAYLIFIWRLWPKVTEDYRV
ncbi:MAG: CPBP family intramembrane metalloprotease [Chloroflexi bacterium]|nr:CPBP family intramembrane metalloprotease [Chloroflexota bacterium]